MMFVIYVECMFAGGDGFKTIHRCLSMDQFLPSFELDTKYDNNCTASAMTDGTLGFPEYGTEIYTKLNNDSHLRTHRVCVC
jgi:hypothetical protein